MTVELASLKRGKVAAYLTVVGNLIGEQTVDIAPRTGGRLLDVRVKLGDRVRRVDEHRLPGVHAERAQDVPEVEA